MRNLSPLLLVVALFSAPASHAIDVVGISATAGSFREGGIFGEYFVSFTVEGFDMAGGRVMKPGAPPTFLCELFFAGPGLLASESWSCELEGFASLDEICALGGFGDFTFELDAAAGLDDAVTVFFDPGCTDPFTGFPQITAPSFGGIVPPVPSDDFCWDCSVPGTCGPGDYAPSISDDATGDLDLELQRGVTTPTCWNPGTCLLPGTYEFAVTALGFEDDFTPMTTAGGDAFAFVSAFENANVVLFSVIDAPPSSPPGVPDGAGVTAPMRVEGLAAGGTSIDLTWDADSCCSAESHHLVHGRSADLPAAPGGTFGVAGGECSLGTTGLFTWTGTPSPQSGDFVWWIVLSGNAGTVEGSWGHDGAGNERVGPGAGGGSGQCGVATRDVGNRCGR